MPDLEDFEKDTIDIWGSIIEGLYQHNNDIQTDQERYPIAAMLTIASVLNGIWKELNDIKRSLEQKV